MRALWALIISSLALAAWPADATLGSHGLYDKQKTSFYAPQWPVMNPPISPAPVTVQAHAHLHTHQPLVQQPIISPGNNRVILINGHPFYVLDETLTYKPPGPAEPAPLVVVNAGLSPVAPSSPAPAPAITTVQVTPPAPAPAPATPSAPSTTVVVNAGPPEAPAAPSAPPAEPVAEPVKIQLETLASNSPVNSASSDPDVKYVGSTNPEPPADPPLVVTTPAPQPPATTPPPPPPGEAASQSTITITNPAPAPATVVVQSDTPADQTAVLKPTKITFNPTVTVHQTSTVYLKPGAGASAPASKPAEVPVTITFTQPKGNPQPILQPGSNSFVFSQRPTDPATVSFVNGPAISTFGYNSATPLAGEASKPLPLPLLYSYGQIGNAQLKEGGVAPSAAQKIASMYTPYSVNINAQVNPAPAPVPEPSLKTGYSEFLQPSNSLDPAKVSTYTQPSQPQPVNQPQDQGNVGILKQFSDTLNGKPIVTVYVDPASGMSFTLDANGRYNPVQTPNQGSAYAPTFGYYKTETPIAFASDSTGKPTETISGSGSGSGSNSGSGTFTSGTASYNFKINDMTELERLYKPKHYFGPVPPPEKNYFGDSEPIILSISAGRAASDPSPAPTNGQLPPQPQPQLQLTLTPATAAGSGPTYRYHYPDPDSEPVPKSAAAPVPAPAATPAAQADSRASQQAQPVYIHAMNGRGDAAEDIHMQFSRSSTGHTDGMHQVGAVETGGAVAGAGARVVRNPVIIYQNLVRLKKMGLGDVPMPMPGYLPPEARESAQNGEPSTS